MPEFEAHPNFNHQGKKIDESSAPHFSPIKKMVSSAPHSLSFVETETHDLKQTKTCKIPQLPIWNESEQTMPKT
jgi:hypothetical protein